MAALYASGFYVKLLAAFEQKQAVLAARLACVMVVSS